MERGRDGNWSPAWRRGGRGGVLGLRTPPQPSPQPGREQNRALSCLPPLAGGFGGVGLQTPALPATGEGAKPRLVLSPPACGGIKGGSWLAHTTPPTLPKICADCEDIRGLRSRSALPLQLTPYPLILTPVLFRDEEFALPQWHPKTEATARSRPLPPASPSAGDC